MTKQKQYFVSWEIDIWADNPRQAAEKALEIQRDPNSGAVVFEIFDNAGGGPFRVDLLEEGE